MRNCCIAKACLMRIIDLSSGLDFKQIDELLSDDDDEQRTTEEAVQEIVADVRRRGDEALCEYTRRFDEHDLTSASIRVSSAEISELAAGADDELVDILKKAAQNVREFHEQQAAESWEYYAGDGVRLGLRVNPLDSAGVYIPGGKATYPAAIIMNDAPARVAGGERI